jgi:hypothetical protein
LYKLETSDINNILKVQPQLVEYFKDEKDEKDELDYYDIKQILLKNPELIDKYKDNLIRLNSISNIIEIQPKFFEKFKDEINKFNDIKFIYFIAQNPSFIDKFKDRVEKFSSTAIKFLLEKQPQLKPYFDNIKPINENRKMKLYSLLVETLNESQSSNETKEEFIIRFEKNNSNPNFLKNNFKNPNFRLELTNNGNVKIKKYSCSLPNKCETNVFIFIKNMVKINNHRYYPVSGWAFMESTSFFEHFWIYDSMENLFLDITPMTELCYAYGGVINFDINDDILKAQKFYDIKFLLGKSDKSLYIDYQDNDSDTLKVKEKSNSDKFNFIHKNEKYKDLSNFIYDNNIENLENLKSYIHKLKIKQDLVRNNREWDYYNNLIQQITNLDI